MPLQDVIATDANRPEKKDQVLNPVYTAWLDFYIKHLFICCDMVSNFCFHVMNGIVHVLVNT